MTARAMTARAIAVLAMAVPPIGCGMLSGFDAFERVDETVETGPGIEIGTDATETGAIEPTQDVLPDRPAEETEAEAPAPIGCAAVPPGYAFCSDFEEDPPTRGWTREGVGESEVRIRFDDERFSGDGGLTVEPLKGNVFASISRTVSGVSGTKATLSLKFRAPAVPSDNASGYLALEFPDGAVRMALRGSGFQRGYVEEVYASDGGFVYEAKDYPINLERWTSLEIIVDVEAKRLTIVTDGFAVTKNLTRIARLGSPAVKLGIRFGLGTPVGKLQYDDVVFRVE